MAPGYSIRKGRAIRHFLRMLLKCRKERLIGLEAQVVFDVLFENNIIVRRGSFFCFRFAYWVYYFAAQRPL